MCLLKRELVYRVFFLSICVRKVKDAWESKREVLEEGGTLAIEQLSKALSTAASSKRLADQISQDAVKLCSEQVPKILSTFSKLIFKPITDNFCLGRFFFLSL